MPRYIDADALLESGICVEYGYNDNGLLLIPMRDVTNSIRNAPTIDAEPVRHGRWIQNKTIPAYYHCSICRVAHKMHASCNKYVMLRYCPYCGAKMDEKEDSHDSE